MGPVTVEELAAILGGELVPAGPGGRAGALVTNVAVNSRRARPGSAFFALPGERTHGHFFVASAAANGATVAVVDREWALPSGPPEQDLDQVPMVVVDDTLVALQALAGWWRQRLVGPVVAVVGSNGKTVTKDCLVHLLSSSHSSPTSWAPGAGTAGPELGPGLVYGAPGSYNSQLGVALALLGCPPEAAVAVVEVAVSGPGEMARQARMVAPDYVVVTNIGTRWRYRFRDRAHQVSEVLSMARAVPGWALLGEQGPDLVSASRGRGVTYVQGLSEELPAYRPALHGPQGARFGVTFPSGESALASVKTVSDEILSDVQLALSAAYLLGAPPYELTAALHDYSPTATRMEIWRSPQGVTVVRDVATPDPIAVASALRAARRLARQGGRTVVVLAEPGPAWDQAAPGLAQALQAEGAEEVCALAAPAHSLTALALEELGAGPHLQVFEDAEELRSHLSATLASGDVCLVQSAPGAVIGDLASSVVDSMSATRLYIDMSAIEDNLLTFRRLLGPHVKVMAMVKALAYGTDPVSISLVLQDLGVDAFGVSSADEGVALRKAGVNLPVLVLLGTPAELAKMVRARLTPLIYSPGMLEAVRRAAAEGQQFKVHVEVDTGFHRAGLQPDEALAALRELSGLAGVEVEGLMTHLASADDPADDDYTNRQLDRFEQVANRAHSLGLRELICHAAASAGAVRFPRARLDMVRLGLGLHGLHLSEATAKVIELTPAMSLVSRLVQVIEVAEGERVGYGGIFTAPKHGARLGVVPAGHHDCVPRAFSNFGYVMVAGRRCPIVGRVSMDSMTIDISACPEASVGSDVLIYGRLGDWYVPLEDVSAAIGTTSHEVMARLGPRVQRIFTRH